MSSGARDVSSRPSATRLILRKRSVKNTRRLPATMLSMKKSQRVKILIKNSKLWHPPSRSLMRMNPSTQRVKNLVTIAILLKLNYQHLPHRKLFMASASKELILHLLKAPTKNSNIHQSITQWAKTKKHGIIVTMRFKASKTPLATVVSS